MTSIKRTSIIRDDFSVGARVLVNNDLSGTIRYVGTTSFQTGKWVGIELDEPLGKNSGVVQGKRYFECKNSHGVFTRPAYVKVINEVCYYVNFISNQGTNFFNFVFSLQHHL